MKRIVLSLVVALTVVALLAAPAMAAGKNGPAGKSDVGHLYLYEKVPSGDWPVAEDPAWGKLNYHRTEEGIEGVFNGKGLDAGVEYALIYYDDPWPGGDASVLIGTAVADGNGNVHIKGSADLDDPEHDPNVGDSYEGYKIWLVLAEDYDEDDNIMIGWNPTEYLFESELIGP